MIDKTRYMRRMIAQQVLNMVTKTEGGPMSLVTVDEWEVATELIFHNDYSINYAIPGGYRQGSALWRVTIEEVMPPVPGALETPRETVD